MADYETDKLSKPTQPKKNRSKMKDVKIVVVKNKRERAMSEYKFKEIKLPVLYKSLDWEEKIQVRNMYIREQNNNCLFCRCSLQHQVPKKIEEKYKINWKLFPDNFMKYPIHLQHDHKTGLTEGAVHNYCNAVLWQYYRR